MWDVARLPLKAKLALLLSVFLSGFAAFFALSYWTLGTVRIGSQAYGKIIQSKDVVADVLPPPEYIIESYLLTLQALDEADPGALRELVVRGDRLRAEYEKRHEHWDEVLEPGQLRRDMIENAYAPAMRFYELRDREVIPALLRGDREKALAVARGPLREQYEAHR